MKLTDTQWLLVEPLIPARTVSPRGGRPILHRRPILDAILHKLATGCPWYDLPFDSPSYATVYRCYHEWQRAGVLLAILGALSRVRRMVPQPFDLLYPANAVEGSYFGRAGRFKSPQQEHENHLRGFPGVAVGWWMGKAIWPVWLQ